MSHGASETPPSSQSVPHFVCEILSAGQLLGSVRMHGARTRATTALLRSR